MKNLVKIKCLLDFIKSDTFYFLLQSLIELTKVEILLPLPTLKNFSKYCLLWGTNFGRNFGRKFRRSGRNFGFGRNWKIQFRSYTTAMPIVVALGKKYCTWSIPPMSCSTQPSFIKIRDLAISLFVCGVWSQSVKVIRTGKKCEYIKPGI